MSALRPHTKIKFDKSSELFRELEFFIQELYEDAKLTLFGSSCNGFHSVGCDFDICLTLHRSNDGSEIGHTKMIDEVARTLRKHPDLTKMSITTARVPIFKFHHVPSNLDWRPVRVQRVCSAQHKTSEDVQQH